MEIKEQRTEEKIILRAEGRIDTNTSMMFQQQVLTAFQTSRFIEIDLEGVDYISSAGLRALLVGAKTAQARGSQMVLTKVHPQVMEVFSMTGFDKVLTFA